MKLFEPQDGLVGGFSSEGGSRGAVSKQYIYILPVMPIRNLMSVPVPLQGALHRDVKKAQGKGGHGMPSR